MLRKVENDFCDNILRIFPLRFKSVLKQYLSKEINSIQEIVLRSHRPLCIYKQGKMYFLAENGCLTDSAVMQKLLIPTQMEMVETFNSACCYSVYSHLSEIKEGFVTVNGGHRVGISGTAVVEGEKIVNIRDISTISVRIAREVIGCGEAITNELIKDNNGMLICGSPCSGKTTVLRDICRLLSTRYGKRVSLVDSRGEIASVYKGVSQMDIGYCDVLDGYPRRQGIEQAVRVMSPEYVICDEIGSDDDLKGIVAGLNSGTLFVASMHAGNESELLQRRNAKTLISCGAFGKIVFLSGRDSPGIVERVIESEALNFA